MQKRQILVGILIIAFLFFIGSILLHFYNYNTQERIQSSATLVEGSPLAGIYLINEGYEITTQGDKDEK